MPSTSVTTAMVSIAGERIRVSLFVTTRGYSRRPPVAGFSHQRRSAGRKSIERTFQHFRGRTQEVLIGNARALVNLRDAKTREAPFNARFHHTSWSRSSSSGSIWMHRCTSERAPRAEAGSATAGHSSFNCWISSRLIDTCCTDSSS